LPGAQDQNAVFDEDLLAAADERTLGMGIGVALGVTKAGIGSRDHLVEGQKDIVDHVRIGVLIDRDRGGRMGTRQGVAARTPPLARQPYGR
jgi:hypothetical protein